MKIYLSGPITGVENYKENFAVAEREALRDRLRAKRKEAGRKKNEAAQRAAAGKETLLIITSPPQEAPAA